MRYIQRSVAAKYTGHQGRIYWELDVDVTGKGHIGKVEGHPGNEKTMLLLKNGFNTNIKFTVAFITNHVSIFKLAAGNSESNL